MSNRAKSIELPEDLQAFAEERVRAGKNASVADVVRDALEEKKREPSVKLIHRLADWSLYKRVHQITEEP